MTWSKRGEYCAQPNVKGPLKCIHLANFGRFVEIPLETAMNAPKKKIVIEHSFYGFVHKRRRENPHSKSHKTVRIERNIRFGGKINYQKRIQRWFCWLLRSLLLARFNAHLCVSSFRIKSIHIYLFLFHSFSSLSAQFHAIMNKSIVKIVCCHMLCKSDENLTPKQNNMS